MLLLFLHDICSFSVHAVVAVAIVLFLVVCCVEAHLIAFVSISSFGCCLYFHKEDRVHRNLD